MPYVVRGKCVYKKKPDGSRGKLVGCTKGSVKKYLAALHIHADKKKKKIGERGYGYPRTEAERRRRHRRLYGTSKLPPRGTGLRKKTKAYVTERLLKG